MTLQPKGNLLRALGRSPLLTPVRQALRGWALRGLPEPLRSVPTMLGADELSKLYELGRAYWDGRGVIIDAGCFLGGSTAALGSGLLANPKLKTIADRPIIETYDLFEIEAYTIERFFPKLSVPGTSFLPDWRRNVAHLGPIVRAHPGDIMRQTWDGRPVEILFIDLAKHWTVNDYVVRTYFPCLIAGHSIVVQQDYLYESWNGWLHVTMELFADHFTLIDSAANGSVFFKYTSPIPPERLAGDIFVGLSRSEIRRLMAASIARFSGSQLRLVERSADHLEALLDSVSWQPPF